MATSSSALKIILLTAATGPLFKGEVRKLEDQCERLQQLVGAAVGPENRAALTADLIRRWRRDGVRRIAPGDNLHTLSHAVRAALGLEETAEELAAMIADDRVTPLAFALRCDVEEIEYDHILAEHLAVRGHFWPPHGHLFVNSAGNSPHPASGIFVVERTGKRRRPTSKALLVIGNHIDVDIDDEPRSFVFVKMYVPQPGAPKPISIYQGMMLQPVNHKYFLLHSVEAAVQDFIVMITDVGALPADRFRGLYTSVNILGQAKPDSLSIDIRRKETVINDDNIRKLGKEHLGPLWQDAALEGTEEH